MSNLKGQTVYVVNTFKKRNDEAVGYEIFANLDDATKAAAIINAATKHTGEYAYYDAATIY